MAKKYICKCGKIQRKKDMHNEFSFIHEHLSCGQCGKTLIDTKLGITHCKVYRKPRNIKKICLDILTWTPFGIHLAFKKMKNGEDMDSFLGGMWSFMNGAVNGLWLILILLLIEYLLK